jgi:flagellar protein FlaG
MEAVVSGGNSSNTSFNVSNVAVATSKSTTNSGSDTTDQAGVLGISTEKDLRTAELQGKKVSFGDEDFVKAMEKAQKAIEGGNTTLEYSVHKETKSIMVKVLDKDTGKVIREIPPEKILDMVAKFCEMAGIYVDKKV